MGDLLIRGMEPELKKRLRDSAQRNNRSLSEEAVALMQRALSFPRPESSRPGDRLRALAGGARFTDEELAAIEASRHESDREPPDFGWR
jgi:hypothetical protein